MGNIIGIDIPYNQVVSACCSCFGTYNDYVHNLEENVEDLYTAMQRLSELRDDVSTRVSFCENVGLKPLARVKRWVSRVEDIEKEVSRFLEQRNQEMDRLCVGGYCSQNCVSSYKYGEEVVKKLGKIKDLMSEGDFPEVGQEGPRPIRTTVGLIGLNPMVDRIWSFMMERTSGILGLYGVGGVGKTTLLTAINNKFLNTPFDFQIVIWVSVSREVQIERIQDDIAKQLSLLNESWKRLGQEEKAVGISNKLRRKKFVLLLDDIRAQLDLTEIGVPVPDEMNGCKIIFNTRSRDVCGLMRADGIMEVKCLEWRFAWDLFQKKAGRKTLENDARIVECAQSIARKCNGLPLPLTTIGVSMRSKTTIEDWERAVDDLTISMARFRCTSDAESVILPLLKFSFDAIKDEKIQSCFLFCASLLEDEVVEKDVLVDHWIGQGMIDGFEDRNKAIKSGHEIIRNLVNACLLIQEGSRHVKMHSMIHQMALWVASDTKREVKNPQEVTRMSLTNDEIVDLKSFHRNILPYIKSKIFQSLPEGISELMSQLPESLGWLVTLGHLNLESKDLNGVASLHSLQTLNLYNCGLFTDRSGSIFSVETSKELAHLKVLTICINGAGDLELFLKSYWLTNPVRVLSVHKYHSHSLEISSFIKMDGLESLVIYSSHVREIKVTVQSAQELCGLSRNIIFHNLCSVTIELCPNLQHLTWLLLARNLTRLTLSELELLEEVIGEDKIDSVVMEQPLVQPFQKLKHLTLMFMPELRSIYETSLTFPCLENITVVNCPKLKKLPLNSESAKGQKLVIQGSEEWIKNVEWEDEATKKAFTLSY